MKKIKKKLMSNDKIREFRNKYKYCDNCYSIVNKGSLSCPTCGKSGSILDFPNKKTAIIAYSNFCKGYYKV